MPPQVETLPTDRLNRGDGDEKRPGQDARAEQRTGRHTALIGLPLTAGHTRTMANENSE